jgi:hypothetical protein
MILTDFHPAGYMKKFDAFRNPSERRVADLIKKGDQAVPLNDRIQFDLSGRKQQIANAMQWVEF